MPKAVKTNAARYLDTLGIAYTLLPYAVDPDDLSAQTVAAKIGRPCEAVFKTLVARGDRHGVCFAVIDGTSALDLKALAAASGDRKIAMVPLAEVQALTGYIRGGVTVFGAKKRFPVFVDPHIHDYAEITISAGQRGLQLAMRPDDYIRAAAAQVIPIARPMANCT